MFLLLSTMFYYAWNCARPLCGVSAVGGALVFRRILGFSLAEAKQNIVNNLIGIHVDFLKFGEQVPLTPNLTI